MADVGGTGEMREIAITLVTRFVQIIQQNFAETESVQRVNGGVRLKNSRQSTVAL